MNEHWFGYQIVRGLETVSPILPYLKDRGYIAGSYAAFMASTAACPVEPHDVDIFAVSDQAARDIAMDLHWNLKLPLPTESAAVIGFDRVSPFVGLSIQIIKPALHWHVFPDDFMASFDLSVSRATLKLDGETPVVLADEGIHAPQIGKVLVINDPVRTLRRIAKYMARGVEFTDWELLKVADAWTKMGSERQSEKMEAARAVAFPEDAIEGEIGPDYSFSGDDDYQCD